MLPTNIPPISRRTPKSRDPDLVKKDLDALASLARDKGADRAAIISGRDAVFDAALARPQGSGAGASNRSEHWPVRYPLDSVEDALKSYEHGIFLGIQGPPGMPFYGQGWIGDPVHRSLFLSAATIVAAVESEAFYRSYHLAAGYGEGNCRSVLCFKEKRCQALLAGRTCLHPYKARPSLAAVGVDARAMARNAGFTSEDFQAMLFGLVMIA